MHLVSLIYASKITDKIHEDGVVDIVQKARISNEKLDVTGLLCFDNSFFLQCLEGSREAVNKLYAKISSDPRHANAILLQYEEISKRQFAKWGMGLALPTKSNSVSFLKYSRRAQFNPFEMSGESAKQLLLALAKKSEIQ